MRKRITFISVFFVLIVSVQWVSAQVRLPKLIANGMVLQRDKPVQLWGWASAGEKVMLNFEGSNYEASANKQGEWNLVLPAQNAGGPFTMYFKASNTIELTDIYFGDVWLFSGQSNMEYPFSRLTDRYAKEIAESENQLIRQFKIPQKYNFSGPFLDYEQGEWLPANPANLLNFSAVAYFFAMEVQRRHQVPVGILHAAVGGTPAEAWMSTDALKEFPQYLAEAAPFQEPGYSADLQQREREAINAWYARLNEIDKGLQSRPTWKDPTIDISNWPTMPVPSYWVNHGLGMVHGAVWFRRSFKVPTSMAGKQVRLFMGRIVDADSVFVNGTLVGTTSYQYPQRNYIIPAGVLVEGENTIVVRVINNSGRGGFVEDKPYMLFLGNDTVQLTGSWHYQLGCTMEPTPGQTFIQYKPTGLFYGMIAPSNNFQIKGVAWYQGESNAGRPQEYQQLLTSLINDWRIQRKQGAFPFLIAQLPNFMAEKDQPGESGWASFRQAQLNTVQSVENTAISVNIDLGEANDIHPQNKKDVAYRLALAAEKLAYGNHKIIASGPVYKSMKIKKNKLELLFDHVGGGLVASDQKPLKYFAIAGADGKFVWANAQIKGKKVVVWSPDVPKPTIVRYAWADNPAGANLANKDGLPASPFTSEP